MKDVEIVDKPRRRTRERKAGTLRFTLSEDDHMYGGYDTFHEAFVAKSKEPGTVIGHVWVTNSPDK